MNALKAVNTPAGVILLVADARQCPGAEQCQEGRNLTAVWTQPFIETMRKFVPFHILLSLVILVLQMAASGSSENWDEQSSDWFQTSCPGLWLSVLALLTGSVAHHCFSDQITHAQRKQAAPIVVGLLFVTSAACLAVSALSLYAVHSIYSLDARKSVVIAFAIVCLIDSTCLLVGACLLSTRVNYCRWLASFRVNDELHLIVSYVARAHPMGTSSSTDFSFTERTRGLRETPPPSYDSMWMASNSNNVLIEDSNSTINNTESTQDLDTSVNELVLTDTGPDAELEA